MSQTGNLFPSRSFWFAPRNRLNARALGTRLSDGLFLDDIKGNLVPWIFLRMKRELWERDCYEASNYDVTLKYVASGHSAFSFS